MRPSRSDTADGIDGRESLEIMLQNHCQQAHPGLLTVVLERQQSLYEQIQRDSAQTQRLRVNLRECQLGSSGRGTGIIYLIGIA